MKRISTLLIPFTFLISAAFSQNVDFNATEVCYGAVTTLIASTDIADADIQSINWDLDNNGYYNDAVGKTVTFTFSRAGVHLVSVKVVDNDDENYLMDEPKAVTVNAIPFVIFPIPNVCEEADVDFRGLALVEGGEIASYSWDFDSDGTEDSDLQTATTFFSSPETVNVTLGVVSTKGCAADTTQEVTVHPKPIAAFSAQNFCHYDSTEFLNASVVSSGTIDYFILNFGDGNQSVSEANPKNVYEQPGTYETRLIVRTDNICMDTAFVDVTINPLPNIEFDFSGDTIFFDGNDVTITASGPFTEWIWSTNEITESITVDSTGLYSIDVTDSKTCKNSKEVNVLVQEIAESAVSNDVITPNGDGMNDYFIIENAESCINCSLDVYNRWGDLMYHSDSYQNDWDASYEGNPLNSGTYFYIYTIGNKYIKGNINILK